MKSIYLDAAVGLWALLVCAAFIVPLVCGVGWTGLELAARYVYLVVVAAGLIGLALRALKTS